MSGDLLAEALGHHQAGRLAEAEQLYRRFLAVHPDHPDALHLLGLLAHACGHHDAARQLIGRAVDIAPDRAVYLQNLAQVLGAMGNPLEAAQCCRRAAQLSPHDPAPWLALARFETENGLMIEAAEALTHVVALCPDDVAARTNLGEALRAQGRFAEAVPHFRHILALAPDHLDARYGLGLCLLSLGEMDEGARLYEDGRYGGRQPRLDILPHLPKWDGGPMPDGTLLLHLEQGAGDVIQFIRYVPWLKQRVGRLVLPQRPELARLLAGIDGIDARLGADEVPQSCDAFVPLISLLALFQGRFPHDVPYLTAEPALARSWRNRLSTTEHLRVGLVWAGNPGHHNDRNRSLPLEMLRPLLALPGIAWFSLQVGRNAADIAQLGWQDRITDPSGEVSDFADTAAILAGLDLVITVDTSVAHLAGAMNCPAWVLIPAISDWRWVVGRDDSAWYPSLRLFRQKASGGWPEVITRLSAALAEVRPPAGRS
ncbi:MAG: tetratricopeptide repeat protein [Magnetospirillum sp.]|nr:tetratricopeptide repeat protein [Magnetospirillum sp.]